MDLQLNFDEFPITDTVVSYSFPVIQSNPS